MAFDLHPILDKDVSPRPGLWYAVAPDDAPAARVGATAIRAMEVGSVLLCAGAAPERAFSDLHELKIDSGKLCNPKRAAKLFCIVRMRIEYHFCVHIGLYILFSSQSLSAGKPYPPSPSLLVTNTQWR